MRRTILAVLSAALLSGCATKGFVTEGDADVGARVTALERALDESEATIEKQAAQLREVDETADNAFALATSAGPQRMRLRRRPMLSVRGPTRSSARADAWCSRW